MTRQLRTLQVRAPKDLGILHDRRDATVRFLARIRACADAAFAGDDREIIVDFRPCRKVSRSACLLITAELKRALHFAGVVKFLPPTDDDVADQFDGFGLYAYFRVASPLTRAQRITRTKNA